jgi:hypothetical protein
MTHWERVKRILRYIKGTFQYGIELVKSSSMILNDFSNTNWAECPNDQRSTSGFVVFLSSNLISWSSKKQVTVSRPSTEVEYKSLTNTMVEFMWLQTLLKELRIPHDPVARLLSMFSALANNMVYKIECSSFELVL